MVNGKILVVDDSNLTRVIISNTLLQAGFHPVKASSGKEGLELFEKEHPKLVITDLLMPEMDGIEFSKKLREKSNVPIILLSVEFNKEIKLRSQKAGINDYLFKDFEKKELVKKVKSLLERV